MTIPFGLACAALLTGRLGHDFLRPLRTWLMVPWTFLTVRDRARRLVGLRGAGLGRLLGLGPGRERVASCRG